MLKEVLRAFMLWGYFKIVKIFGNLSSFVGFKISAYLTSYLPNQLLPALEATKQVLILFNPGAVFISKRFCVIFATPAMHWVALVTDAENKQFPRFMLIDETAEVFFHSYRDDFEIQTEHQPKGI